MNKSKNIQKQTTTYKIIYNENISLGNENFLFLIISMPNEKQYKAQIESLNQKNKWKETINLENKQQQDVLDAISKKEFQPSEFFDFNMSKKIFQYKILENQIRLTTDVNSIEAYSPVKKNYNMIEYEENQQSSLLKQQQQQKQPQEQQNTQANNVNCEINGEQTNQQQNNKIMDYKTKENKVIEIFLQDKQLKFSYPELEDVYYPTKHTLNEKEQLKQQINTLDINIIENEIKVFGNSEVQQIVKMQQKLKLKKFGKAQNQVETNKEVKQAENQPSIQEKIVDSQNKKASSLNSKQQEIQKTTEKLKIMAVAPPNSNKTQQKNENQNKDLSFDVIFQNGDVKGKVVFKLDNQNRLESVECQNLSNKQINSKKIDQQTIKLEEIKNDLYKYIFYDQQQGIYFEQTNNNNNKKVKKLTFKNEQQDSNSQNNNSLEQRENSQRGILKTAKNSQKEQPLQQLQQQNQKNDEEEKLKQNQEPQQQKQNKQLIEATPIFKNQSITIKEEKLKTDQSNNLVEEQEKRQLIKQYLSDLYARCINNSLIEQDKNKNNDNPYIDQSMHNLQSLDEFWQDGYLIQAYEHSNNQLIFESTLLKAFICNLPKDFPPDSNSDNKKLFINKIKDFIIVENSEIKLKPKAYEQFKLVKSEQNKPLSRPQTPLLTQQNDEKNTQQNTQQNIHQNIQQKNSQTSEQSNQNTTEKNNPLKNNIKKLDNNNKNEPVSNQIIQSLEVVMKTNKEENIEATIDLVKLTYDNNIKEKYQVILNQKKNNIKNNKQQLEEIIDISDKLIETVKSDFENIVYSSLAVDSILKSIYFYDKSAFQSSAVTFHAQN